MGGFFRFGFCYEKKTKKKKKGIVLGVATPPGGSRPHGSLFRGGRGSLRMACTDVKDDGRRGSRRQIGGRRRPSMSTTTTTTTAAAATVRRRFNEPWTDRRSSTLGSTFFLWGGVDLIRFRMRDRRPTRSAAYPSTGRHWSPKVKENAVKLGKTQ